MTKQYTLPIIDCFWKCFHWHIYQNL